MCLYTWYIFDDEYLCALMCVQCVVCVCIVCVYVVCIFLFSMCALGVYVMIMWYVCCVCMCVCVCGILQGADTQNLESQFQKYLCIEIT